MISVEYNDKLCGIPSMEEVHDAVFKLNGSSSYGPDGL